jgi:serine/threonine protein kinase
VANLIHRPVVHGDLKPENLLLSSWDIEEAELKLVDFGCSKIVDDCIDGGHPPHSNIAYDAPEKIINKSNSIYKSDVWAAGCIPYASMPMTHYNTIKNLTQQRNPKMRVDVNRVCMYEKLLRPLYGLIVVYYQGRNIPSPDYLNVY